MRERKKEKLLKINEQKTNIKLRKIQQKKSKAKREFNYEETLNTRDKMK